MVAGPERHHPSSIDVEKPRERKLAELIDFRIGEAAPVNTFLAIWMAIDAGIYQANGLNPEVVSVVGGKQSGPDLASGRIHLMHIGMSSVVRANAAGGNLVTIGALSNIIRNSMFGAPTVKSAADLKGGTVGISSTGSETDATTTLALRSLGLTREDVTIKEIGTGRLDAVRNGEVSASLIGEPFRSQAFSLGLPVLLDLCAAKTPWLFSGLVVHRDFLKRHRDSVLRFMRATVEGNYIAVADAGRAKAVLAKSLSLTDDDIIDKSYANFRAETPMDAEMSRDGARNIIDIVATGSASRNVDDYIDDSIQDELRAEGFFTLMRKRYGIDNKDPV
jgi:ABC-type nitrate/sulfonate/bicarbonate transport system substrate-binding protein